MVGPTNPLHATCQRSASSPKIISGKKIFMTHIKNVYPSSVLQLNMPHNTLKRAHLGPVCADSTPNPNPRLYPIGSHGKVKPVVGLTI